MKTPRWYSADEIKHWEVQCQDVNGFWKCARPMSYPGLNIVKRFKMAWWVFTGKGDVLMWEVEND